MGASGGGGRDGHPQRLPPDQAGAAAGGPCSADGEPHRHRTGAGAAGGGRDPKSGGLCPLYVGAPPHGPDGQRHDAGRRMALQSEVSPLLRRRTAHGREPGADHRAVEGGAGAPAPRQYPAGDLHRRRTHPPGGSGGAGGGRPVVRDPPQHQRPPADAGAVPPAV